MTHIYSVKSQPFQLDFATIATSLQARLKGLADGYLSRRAKRRNLAALRALTPETLDDIGVDVAELTASPPSIARLNPYVVAFAGFGGHRFFLVQE